MKKILFMLVISLTSCAPKGSDSRSNNSWNERVKAIGQSDINDAPVVTREGCEYLVFDSYASCLTYVHKGNCKNPIHQR